MARRTLTAGSPVVVALCVAGAAGSASAQIPVRGVGVLSPAHDRSALNGVSADGAVAFGWCGLPPGPGGTPGRSEAVIFTFAGGLESLGSLGGNAGLAAAASADGSVIVGWSKGATPWKRAFRWTRAGGMQDLGSLGGMPGSEATAITPDGAAICGLSFDGGASASFRWMQGAGFQEIGAWVSAVAISASGGAVVCQGGTTGYLWTEAGGLQALPPMQNPPWFPTYASRPVWISPDGSALIGTVRDPTGDWNMVYRWTQAQGYGSILPHPGWADGIVEYVSPGGALVGSWLPLQWVQLISVNGAQREAIGYLRERGADFAGWEFPYVIGVSDDLRTFVGGGYRTGPEGWIVRLPALCYANCDDSTQAPALNIQDFSCFLGRYAAGEPYANCDGSTQPPVLNVQDFACFLTRYAAGCW